MKGVTLVNRQVVRLEKTGKIYFEYCFDQLLLIEHLFIIKYFVLNLEVVAYDFGVWFSFQAVASEAGTVEIYNLKSEFSDLPQKEFEELNSTFTRYIDLL